MLRSIGLLFLLCLIPVSGCIQQRIGEVAYPRKGDEIMVAGVLYHTGAPVVLWTDPGGYDAYRTEKRFAQIKNASWEATKLDGKGPDSPARYSPRFFRFAEKQPEPWPGIILSDAQISGFRGGVDLESLQGMVDQFVLHYDVCGTSRTCFRVLHDLRGLSIHFMLDIDGTIYQTLDLKERAFHATSSNDRSVGIEIANMGAYAEKEKSTLPSWYEADENGRVRITVPQDKGDGGIRTKNFVGYPARQKLIAGMIQGRELKQWDLTEQQYDSLTKLTAALNKALPKIKLDYPRDAQGTLITRELPETELRGFTGVLGHYHIQDDKSDPGSALDWDRIINGARKIVGQPALPAGNAPVREVEPVRGVTIGPAPVISPPPQPVEAAQTPIGSPSLTAAATTTAPASTTPNLPTPNSPTPGLSNPSLPNPASPVPVVPPPLPKR